MTAIVYNREYIKRTTKKMFTGSYNTEKYLINSCNCVIISIYSIYIVINFFHIILYIIIAEHIANIFIKITSNCVCVMCTEAENKKD